MTRLPCSRLKAEKWKWKAPWNLKYEQGNMEHIITTLHPPFVAKIFLLTSLWCCWSKSFPLVGEMTRPSVSFGSCSIYSSHTIQHPLCSHVLNTTIFASFEGCKNEKQFALFADCIVNINNSILKLITQCKGNGSSAQVSLFCRIFLDVQSN